MSNNGKLSIFSPTIADKQMSEMSKRAIKRNFSALQKIGVLMTEGKNNDDTL